MTPIGSDPFDALEVFGEVLGLSPVQREGPPVHKEAAGEPSLCPDKRLHAVNEDNERSKA